MSIYRLNKKKAGFATNTKMKGDMDMEQKSARVKPDTDSKRLAGYLAYIFEDGKTEHELDCIGPAAISAANKAVASARCILAPKGINIAFIPSFFQTMTENRASSSEDESKTGIRCTVFRY
jgi:stage V sporulation protein SpoVS